MLPTYICSMLTPNDGIYQTHSGDFLRLKVPHTRTELQHRFLSQWPNFMESPRKLFQTELPTISGSIQISKEWYRTYFIVIVHVSTDFILFYISFCIVWCFELHCIWLYSVYCNLGCIENEGLPSIVFLSINKGDDDEAHNHGFRDLSALKELNG